MPIIQFSVNTDIQSVNQHTLLGSSEDGSFRLSHKMGHVPPPETEFTVKHVSLSASLMNNTDQRRSKPLIWMGVEFPQLSDEIIARSDTTITVQDLNPDAGFKIQPPHPNTRGVLRFPLTTYPVDGWYEDGVNLIDSNIPSRFEVTTTPSRNYMQTGTHITNISMGRMRLSEGFLNVVITPYDEFGRIFTQTIGADRTVKVTRMQIILEYK